MELSSFISSCSNRQVIYNKATKEYISVNCGKCAHCANAKSNKYAFLCNNESSKHQFCFFVTLTYADTAIPTAEVSITQNEDTSTITYRDITFRQLVTEEQVEIIDKKTNTPKLLIEATLRESKLSTYNTELAQFILKPKQYALFNEFISQVNSSKNTDDKKHIHFCSKEDLRNFLKRLRYYISKDFDEQIRYYAVAEYGPVHFRPHYHILLYFDEPQLATSLEALVNKAWQFGITDVQQASNNGNVASYVSSYANSITDLPSFLNFDALKVFNCHSVFFGSLAHKVIRDYMYEDVKRATDVCSVPYGSVSIPYIPYKSVINQLFPRCYNFDNQDKRYLSQLYCIYQTLSIKYPYCNGKVNELTKEVIYNQDSFINNEFLRHLDILPYDTAYTLFEPYCYVPTPQKALHLMCYHDISLDHHYNDIESPTADDTLVTAFNRIYSAIYMSKHFLEFCCENISPDKALSLIHDYYNNNEQYKLSTMYKAMQEYYETTGSTDYSIFFQIDECDLLNSTTNSKAMQRKYKAVYDANGYVRDTNSIKLQAIHDKTKHKYLNDANLIFCNIF